MKLRMAFPIIVLSAADVTKICFKQPNTVFRGEKNLTLNTLEKLIIIFKKIEKQKISTFGR